MTKTSPAQRARADRQGERRPRFRVRGCQEGAGANKSPERFAFSGVALERGATEDRDMFDWFQDVAITSSGLDLTDVNYRRNLNIVQQDDDSVPQRCWSLSRAWPTKIVACEWNNESDEKVIEQVTLTFDCFELVQ